MASNIIIRNSKIHNGQRGINADTGGGHKIYNNLVYNNTGIAIVVEYGGGADVYNNTIYGNGGYALAFGDGGTSSAKNNIIFNHSSLGIIVLSNTTTNVVISNNLSSNNGTNYRDDSGRAILSNNKFGNQYNPQFANAAAGNFWLLTGSDAIDAGVAIPGLTTDFAGVGRPRGGAYDIGAYEF